MVFPPFIKASLCQHDVTARDLLPLFRHRVDENTSIAIRGEEYPVLDTAEFRS
jgi:hypothetical protein